MKRKDALTDLVEHAREGEAGDAQSSSSGDRQVANSEGEIITLGNDGGKKVRFFHKGKHLELPLTEVKKMVEPIVKRAFADFEKKVVKNIMDELERKSR